MSNNPGMFEDAKAGELCDLVLECDGVRLSVHKVVVWNWSEVIKTACKSNFKKEGRTNVVQIPDFSLATVKRMVEYMYLEKYTLGNELKWISELAGLRVDTSSDLAAAPASDTSLDFISLTESANETTDSTPPTTAEILRPHLEMSMIAGYYLVPGLETFALEEITKALKQTWSPAGIDDLISEVYPSLPHEATRRHLSELVVEHLNDVPINETLFPDPFSLQVISALRRELTTAKESIKALTEKSLLSDTNMDWARRQYLQLKANLDNLQDIRHCRHCGKGFNCQVEHARLDEVACMIRCRECRTRHYGPPL
ncbi:hypothetical protein BO82DRAFT_432801 [Aspergillus uvarum CBS 121591]|uniref:BTB domain-containing protein n=1 Tax=Aspergillus uvarum CBS 121591 TaxID=1448315 RepID=A0A319C734_9EURO|nr:hypothetical protein BO82DRAFT_432801 [Aspergillus uvarum CBS 121591]PYH81165.1 hypothetical protein BO82DRAFT_432801 [Aspergillus uvarum CBS 121591]